METCIEEKKKFEDCFKEWLNNGLLTGEFGSLCVNEWKIYEQCLNKELAEKNLLDLKSFTTLDPSVDKSINYKGSINKKNEAIKENSKN
ncbi:hypothetical protein CPHLJ_5g2345 [Cryptosporidium parvum]|nr:hypothetical protein CPCDC_5g2345 [Cryptosporidium sp. 43IA8]WRK32380.1 hypothetical protein cpbgf_5002346 [Cryptosporidium parvum]